MSDTTSQPYRLQKELNAMRRRRPTILVSVVAVVAASLLAAGCGGGSASPGVASVASSTTTAATTTQSGSGSGDQAFGGSGGGQHEFQVAMNTGNAAQGAKFAACMRKHGVTNFPDPNSQGVITFGSGMGIDPNSPTFSAARSACEKLLPNGGQPTPAQQAQRQKEMLAFSQCMRAHGIKDFPDPTNGGLRIQVHPGSDLNPNNPQFQRAQTACQGHLPFKTGAAGAPPAKPGAGG